MKGDKLKESIASLGLGRAQPSTRLFAGATFSNSETNRRGLLLEAINTLRKIQSTGIGTNKILSTASLSDYLFSKNPEFVFCVWTFDKEPKYIKNKLCTL